MLRCSQTEKLACRHNLTPCVTLHHFAHPLWFEKLGAFEKEENVHYFVDFAKLAFR